MKLPATKLQIVDIDPKKRILVTSDIHGNLPYFKTLLDKAAFCDEDILIIVGDIVEKGPDSLGTLRYVMSLCESGNVFPLIGNVDAYRLQVIHDLNSDNAASFYRYLLGLREWCGSSFYDELANECGYTLNAPEDVLRCRDDIVAHFEKEFHFLSGLPTILETQNYTFVHGGLRERKVAQNCARGVFELTKYDDFANKTPHTFDKYVVVGHWPVSLYSNEIQQLNPVINHEKRIISIDGGCGIKSEGQLNLLILPSIQSTPKDMTYISYDDIPLIRAREDQPASADPIHIYWVDRQIKMLTRGEEFSEVEHMRTGRRLRILNSYLINDSECYDYTNYALPVKKGESLSLITKSSEGCIVKKDGVVGWYFGEYEE